MFQIKHRSEAELFAKNVAVEHIFTNVPLDLPCEGIFDATRRSKEEFNSMLELHEDLHIWGVLPDDYDSVLEIMIDLYDTILYNMYNKGHVL